MLTMARNKYDTSEVAARLERGENVMAWIRGEEGIADNSLSAIEYSYDAQAGSYTVDHMAFTFVLDRDGRYVAFLPPGTRADRMATLLRQTLGDK